MTYEHSSGSGHPASLDVEIYDIDCLDLFLEHGCTKMDETGQIQRCPMLTEDGHCGLAEITK